MGGLPDWIGPQQAERIIEAGIRRAAEAGDDVAARAPLSAVRRSSSRVAFEASAQGVSLLT